MKKSAKKIQSAKGGVKITDFFGKKENAERKESCSSEINVQCNEISSGTVSKNDIKTPLPLKRKVEDADALSPQQRKKHNICKRELTPERNRSIGVDLSNPTIYVKSPEQLLCPEALVEYYTPEKKLERFMDRIRSPTPKKLLFNEELVSTNNESSTFLSKIDEISRDRRQKPVTPKKITPKRAIQSTLQDDKSVQRNQDKTKRTPKKLFNKSPSDINKFNVQIIDNFIKVTPSKSHQRIDPDVEYVSSSEKKQSSILKYISPSISIKSMKVQSTNETTPTKNEANICSAAHTPVSRVKIKLNFSQKSEEPSTSNTIVIRKSNSPKRNIENVKENQNDDVSDPKMLKSHEGSNRDQENDLNTINLNFSFDDGWHEEWYEDIIVPTQFNQKLDLTNSQHCEIVNINTQPTKNVIILKSTKNEERAICILAGFWLHSQLHVGDKVHVSAKKLNEFEWIVDNDHGLLVYEPDLLISVTSVVNTLWCKRRSVLTDRFRGFEPGNIAMLVGSLVHNLLEHVLRNKIHSQKEIERISKDFLKKRSTISQIYECDLTVDSVEEELMKYIPKIVSFIHLYVKDINVERQPKLKHKKEDWKGTIDAIDDIEENIWCPELGIKGKVDVSVRTDTNIMPLEVKTGRTSVSLEHRGQVLMYIMMMNKLGHKVSSGLLLYLRDGVLREVPPTQKEQRDIIILRNELAYYLTRKPKVVEGIESGGNKLFPPELPEPINHISCAKCPYNVICTSYAKYYNEDISSNKTLKSIQDEVFFYLDEAHLNYFMHWVSLIALEANSKTGSKDLREIYTLPPEERETNGQCIINLKVAHIGEECNGVYEHTFQRIQGESGFNFFSHGIVESNYIVVSTAKRPAVSAGFVTDITTSSITVTLDRNLNDKYQNHTFSIDSYDSSSIQSYNLTSLTLLMELSERGEKLRRIIIDKMSPTFQSRLPKSIGVKGKAILKRLNTVQQRAVLQAVAANDYFLIKGMPGTGKTSTIVALIQLLVELGKTVIITSHTHSAVDNVCVRLVSYGVKLLRLGSQSRIHPSLKEYSEYNLTKDCTTPEELKAVYNSAQVIAVTCLGSSHPILSKRKMDICVVDESTQVLQSSIIRPLHSAKTFILIGDPNQLPALVQNKEALDMGMSESLFERLNSPEATTALNLNYRMNTAITALANHFTYDGELLIGSEAVANATLVLPNKEALGSKLSNWLLKTLDSKMENAVQFLDTGPVFKLEHIVTWRTNKQSTIEENTNRSCANIYEAALTFHLVKALLQGGVPCSDIGVIATYRAQVAQISFLLQKDGVDISTVDQFQGKDKNVIIYSSSRSRDVSVPKTDYKYEILEDKRRLTVAITRAKHKLIVLGDISTLREYSTFKKMLPYVEKNVIRLYESLDFKWDDVIEGVQIE